MDPFEKHIIIKGTSPGYLVTERSFSDYQLSLDWRWALRSDNPPNKPIGKQADQPQRTSGILFHIAGEADLVWPKSIQADLRADHVITITRS